MAGEIRIVIADDHPIYRGGLRQVVEENPNLLVVGEASDGEAALAQIDRLRPEIAILDIDMPKLDGFGVVRELQKKRSPVRVVFLTMHAKADLFHAAMELDVRGYILKDSAVLEVVHGLLAIAAGQHYVSAPLTALLLNRGRQREAFAEGAPDLAGLTESEHRILRMIAASKSSKDIAHELCIHYRTVENRRTLICQKLGLRGSNALLKYALENKVEI